MLRIGIYGSNGHQIHNRLPLANRATLVAHAACDASVVTEIAARFPEARAYGHLDDLLADPEIDAVSLCSPRRAEQPAHTLAALRAGKHVYAEKPCAFSEKQLDELRAAARAGRVFREMSGSTYESPFWQMRGLVRSGVLGEIVQVFAQKSYPDHDARLGDERVDGGLVRHVGIHALRWITQCTGLKIHEISCRETRAGLRDRGDLCSAATLSMSLENGALALAAVNYCNQRTFPTWGNDSLRIWGVDGFIEADATRTRLVLRSGDMGPLDLSQSGPDDLAVFVEHALNGVTPPIGEEEEFHATRMILRAKAASTPGFEN